MLAILETALILSRLIHKKTNTNLKIKKMRTIKILLITLFTLTIASCEKEETNSLEAVDLKFEQSSETKQNPKNFFASKCNATLKFNLRTDEDKMGKFAANEMVEFRGKIWSVGGYLNNRSYPF